MFMNKEGKLFGKISIIDLLVVLAIAAAALGAYSRFMVPNEKVSTDVAHIEYTMKIKEVRMGTVKALSKFSSIKSAETKEYMGDIVGIEYTDALAGRSMLDGSVKTVNIPEKYDVTITVRVDGSVNSSGYYTATNQMLTAGSRHVFLSKYAKTTGEIMSVKEVSE